MKKSNLLKRIQETSVTIKWLFKTAFMLLIFIGNSPSNQILCQPFKQIHIPQTKRTWEENTGKSKYFLGFGIGTNYFGPVLGTSFSYTFDRYIFSARYLKADEFTFNVEGHYDEPKLSLNEFGVLFGIIGQKEYIVYNFLGGIGYMNATDRGKQISYGKYEKLSLSAISFPVEVNFILCITKYFGFGGSFYGNLNVKKTYYGGMLKLYLGQL